VSREDRLNSKISAGAVAGAADLVRSPLHSRSTRSRSAPRCPIFLRPAHRSAPPEFWPTPLRFPLRSHALSTCHQTNSIKAWKARYIIYTLHYTQYISFNLAYISHISPWNSWVKQTACPDQSDSPPGSDRNSVNLAAFWTAKICLQTNKFNIIV